MQWYRGKTEQPARPLRHSVRQVVVSPTRERDRLFRIVFSLTSNRRKSEFPRELEPADYQYLVERWEKKTLFCRQGDFLWGLFIARKPD